MKKEMMIKAIEDLLDNLHSMPDGMDEMEGEGEVQVMKAELPMKAELEIEGEEEEPMTALGKSNAGVASEAEDEIEGKAVAPKGPKKPGHLFEMLMGEGGDDPSLDEYLAKKRKAKESEAKFKM